MKNSKLNELKFSSVISLSLEKKEEKERERKNGKGEMHY